MHEKNNQTSTQELCENSNTEKNFNEKLEQHLPSLVQPSLYFDLVLDRAPFAYYQLDTNGNTLYINKKWEEMHDTKLSKVINTPFIDALPVSVKDEFQMNFNKAVSGDEVAGDFTMINKQQQAEHYRFNIFPTFKDDRIVGVEGFITDITDYKETEDELQASQEKYRIISENIPVVVYSALADENSTNLFLSGKIEELTGFSKNDFYNKPQLWKKIIHPEDKKFVEASIKKHRTSRSQLNIEYRIVTNTGEIKWIRDVASPLINNDGTIERISGFMEDISDRKNAERALKMSEVKFRSLFDESQNCIYITAANGQIIDMNPAGLTLFGYSKEEMLSRNSTSLYSNIADRLRFKRILDKEGVVKDFEVELQKKDETKINCIISSSVRKNDKGKILGYQGIISDVTSQKKAESELIKAKEEAEKADRIKTEFLAQMSHEIRTPINTILSFISLINEEFEEVKTPIMEEYFLILNRAGKRIIRTIDLILNMSEIQTDSYQPKLSSVDLAAVLADLHAEYNSIASEKNIELLMNINKTDVTIKADEYSTSQIISNLLDNALKYTEKGTIKVEVKETNKNVKLKLTDTGIGISKKFLPNLFDSFSQEEQGYTRKFEGSGLGLALVKKYCEINNASISVESTKGKGTTFTITFKK